MQHSLVRQKLDKYYFAQTVDQKNRFSDHAVASLYMQHTNITNNL